MKHILLAVGLAFAGSVFTAQANLGDSALASKKRYGSAIGPTSTHNLERWIYRHGGYDIYVQYNDAGKTEALSYVRTPLVGVDGANVYGPITSDDISHLMEANAPGVIFREVPSQIAGMRMWLASTMDVCVTLSYTDIHFANDTMARAQVLDVWTQKALSRASAADPKKAQEPAPAPTVPNNRIDLPNTNI
jgi:hypothetical protein